MVIKERKRNIIIWNFLIKITGSVEALRIATNQSCFWEINNVKSLKRIINDLKKYKFKNVLCF